jgi:tetratricopeptide (TPR) repeat protein
VQDADLALLGHPENSDAFGFFLQSQAGAPVIEGAVELVQAADLFLGRNPDCAWVYAIRSEGYRRRAPYADLAKCRDSLKRSVSLEPGRAWARAYLARAISSNAEASTYQPEEALDQMDAAVRLAPRSGWIRVWRGAVHARLGNHEAALRDYDEGIRLDPTYLDAYHWRGDLKCKLGDLEGAEVDLRTCLNSPQRASPRRKYAALLRRLRASRRAEA